MPGQGNELRAAVADRQTGWVERLPERWRDYATLARWDRPIGTWLLLLPCWWGQALAGPLPEPLADAAVRDRRRRHARRRLHRSTTWPTATSTGRWRAPATGRWPPAGWARARRCCSSPAQCLVGLLVLTALNLPAVLVAFASVPLIVIYPFMKRITYWPQAFLGITFNWGALVGYAAVDRRARCRGPAALRGRLLLDPGLRHDLRPPGQGGRRADRREVDGAAARAPPRRAGCWVSMASRWPCC